MGAVRSFRLALGPAALGDERAQRRALIWRVGCIRWLGVVAAVALDRTPFTYAVMVGVALYNIVPFRLASGWTVRQLRILGWTTYWNCSGGTYTSVTAYYNGYYTDGYSDPAKKQVMAHELGHAMGLNHSGSLPCPVPIMYYTSDRYFQCREATPQGDDVAGINALYP